MNFRATWFAAMAAISALAAQPLWAQEAYPSKPITIIVPLGTGGTADPFVRSITEIASKDLGQQFVIENRPGGNMTVGAGTLMRAKPDGYTIGLFAGSQVLTHLFHDTPYDVSKDFTYIMGLVSIPVGAVVRADSPYKTFDDLIDAAKKAPGTISIGHVGAGTGGHLVMEQLDRKLGIKFREVPFKGGAEYITALLGGHIDTVFGSPGWTPQVDAGEFRFLANFADTRMKKYPDVPTAKELGYDVGYSNSFGFVGPAGMDQSQVEKLHQAFDKAAKNPEFIAVTEKFLLDLWIKSPAEYAAWVKEEQKNAEEIGAAMKKAAK